MDLTTLRGSAFDAVTLANDASVVLVAADDGHEVDACLVGFHSQCSINPLRYAVWLSKANHTYRIASRAEVLSVHWLPGDRRDLAEWAGAVTLDRDPEKMRRLDWRRGPARAVVLDDAVVAFAGRIHHRHEGGDHVCFVVEPFAAWGSGSSGGDGVLRFAAVRDIEAGHEP